MTKHDELVEEIAGQIRHYKYFAEKRAPTPSDRIKASFDLAEDFITLILSAFHDGRLDEELGVVGRWPIDDEIVKASFRRRLGEKSDFLLIALCKEERHSE